MAALATAAIGLAPSRGLHAQEPAGRAPAIASYSIDAALDPAARTLTGREIVTWRNPGTIPAYSIRLHLYWNAFRNTTLALGVEIRAGLHTGECTVDRGVPTGPPVTFAARVAGCAQPGEVLVSRTVRDIVGDAGLPFEDRGVWCIPEIGEWKLFSV